MEHSQNLVIVRGHEIALKGRNRPFFFERLARNLREALRGTGAIVQKRHLEVEITLAPETPWPDISQRLKGVFGVAKFYRCYRLPPSLDAIKEFLTQEVPRHTFGSFRITARRGDKSFPMTAPEMNRELGSLVQQLTGARVSLKEPEANIFVEVLRGEALVYFQEEAGPGGLPVGVSGRVAALLSGGIDSPVAAWRMMKRGCHVLFVHFHSFPLLEGTSREKAVEMVELLSRYQFRSTIFLVPFADVQRDIVLSVPPAYRVIIYRRFMARIAQRIAEEQGAKALVTGESLGQVSSQTLENLATIRSAVGLPILSPLIGMDKQEIIDEARRLGTYPISIIPDEDCCTLFVPSHPATRSTTEEVERLESSLDIPALVNRAVSQAEVRRFAPEGVSPR